MCFIARLRSTLKGLYMEFRAFLWFRVWSPLSAKSAKASAKAAFTWSATERCTQSSNHFNSDHVAADLLKRRSQSNKQRGTDEGKTLTEHDTNTTLKHSVTMSQGSVIHNDMSAVRWGSQVKAKVSLALAVYVHFGWRLPALQFASEPCLVAQLKWKVKVENSLTICGPIIRAANQ